MEMQYALISATGNFPVPASDLNLVKYAAMGTIGHMEEEEAAVRLLFFSQNEGKFVGVSWNDVMFQVLQECNILIQHNDMVTHMSNRYQIEWNKFSLKRKTYRKWAWLTLGTSMFFMESPIAPAKINAPELDSEMKNLFSIVMMYGADAMQKIINAFWALIEAGLVRKESHNGTEYFFPTDTLVAKIARI